MYPHTIIIDTETTGLAHEPDARPWQIAALVLDADLTQIASCVIEGCPDVMNENAQEALSVSNKTVADIQSLPPLSQSIPALAAFLHALPNAKLTAYNIPFDRVMLGRVGITTHDDQWGPCVKDLASVHVGHKVRLIEISKQFGIPHDRAHDALSDCITTAAVLRRLRVG
jgi:DNA polymerase III epsilon subunit-like protein